MYRDVNRPGHVTTTKNRHFGLPGVVTGPRLFTQVLRRHLDVPTGLNVPVSNTLPKGVWCLPVLISRSYTGTLQDGYSRWTLSFGWSHVSSIP